MRSFSKPRAAQISARERSFASRGAPMCRRAVTTPYGRQRVRAQSSEEEMGPLPDEREQRHDDDQPQALRAVIPALSRLALLVEPNHDASGLPVHRRRH